MTPQEESKIVEDPVQAPEDSEDSGEDVEADPNAPAHSKSGAKKKSKKKNKGKQVATGDGDSAEQSGKKLPKAMVGEILKQNPALATEFRGMEKSKVEDMVRAMKLEEILTGLVSGLWWRDDAFWTEVDGISWTGHWREESERHGEP
jgi:glycylpeptide N-tetradecanoyltransferase